MTRPIMCPDCRNDTPEQIAEYEIQGYRDEISFWICKDCGTIWSRWSGEIIPDETPLTVDLAKEHRQKFYEQLRGGDLDWIIS